jgi:uncharacterized membrane protein YeaQ/YmgE (transglycosylase-associated protein family)
MPPVDIVVYLFLLALSGLFVGAFARLALPGPDPMSLVQTTLIGIAGSFAAGLIALALFDSAGAGLLLSILCATVIVYLVRRSRGGSLSEPYAGYKRERRGLFR